MAEPFVPHRIRGDYYSCHREDLGTHLDDIMDFIDEHKAAVFFVIDDGKPMLVLMDAEEYERHWKTKDGENSSETELITIPVSPDEKESIESFSRSVGMSVSDVLVEFMKSIAKSKIEVLDRYNQGENAEKLVTEIADRTFRELEKDRETSV